MGGDEFVILLEDCDDAVAVLARIFDAFAQPATVGPRRGPRHQHRCHRAQGGAAIAMSFGLPYAEDLAVLGGIVDALDWLLGTRNYCPVLGLDGSVTAEVAATANAEIEDVSSELADGPGKDQRSYACGVALVLGWVTGDEQVPSVY